MIYDYILQVIVLLCKSLRLQSAIKTIALTHFPFLSEDMQPLQPFTNKRRNIYIHMKWILFFRRKIAKKHRNRKQEKIHQSIFFNCLDFCLFPIFLPNS